MELITAFDDHSKLTELSPYNTENVPSSNKQLSVIKLIGN